MENLPPRTQMIGEVQPARLKMRLTSKGKAATVSAEYNGTHLLTSFDGHFAVDSIDEAVAKMGELALGRLLEQKYVHPDTEAIG